MKKWNPFCGLVDVDGTLQLLDQTLLPSELKYIPVPMWKRCGKQQAVACAWGSGELVFLLPTVLCCGMCEDSPEPRGRVFRRVFSQLSEVTDYLAGVVPTAVNLFWALDRMKAKAASLRGHKPSEMTTELFQEARAIHAEDRRLCRAIGKHGADLILPVLGSSHALQCRRIGTAEYGTALAVIFTCQDQGKPVHVFVDENTSSAPRFATHRLGVSTTQNPCHFDCDNMAAQVMREGRVQAVVVGADRIAANGDTATKLAPTPWRC